MSEFVKSVEVSFKRTASKLSVKTPTGKTNSNPPSVERRKHTRKRRLHNIFKELK
jgi:hypothetical protein